ncbi:MAG: glucosamine-6-phosphate deaminase [Propionibacterium sp.]|nr:glucosamine-6-phosphate deaminase [Propionibacterium sp.]
MDIVICRDAEQAGVVAAELIVKKLGGNPAPVLGLATGSSPLGLYAHLKHMQSTGEVDLSRARGFALDEYVAIDYEHPESYHNVIRRTVVEPLGLDPELIQVPDGAADDVALASVLYEKAIQVAGGIDLQILGIGANGHIGFNEPFSSFGSRTRAVPLTAQTRADNARFFDSPDQVPTHAITQGLATIRESRATLLIATGEHKASAIGRMIEGPVAVAHPASILQFHPDLTVVVDEAAGARLVDGEHFLRL